MNKYEDNFWLVLWQYLPSITKALSVVVLIGSVFSLFSAFGGKSTPIDGGTFDISLQKKYNATLGNMKSSLVLVYLVDYQCPACKGNNPSMQTVKKEYGDKVGFVYKHFPLESLHPYARNAAKSVQAAGKQGKFFEFGDKVFDNQEKGLSNSTMENIAKELNLDINKFNDDRNSTEISKQIEADQDDLKQIELPANVKGDSKASGSLEKIGTPISILYKDNKITDWWTGGLGADTELKKKIDNALQK